MNRTVRVKGSLMEPRGPRRGCLCSLGLPRGVLREMAFAIISLKKHSLCPSKKADRWSEENERVPGEPPFQRVLLRWPKRGPQPSPALTPLPAMRATQPSPKATPDGTEGRRKRRYLSPFLGKVFLSRCGSL